MILRLPDHLRARLDQKYLDWAERLPPTNWEPVRTLRSMRERQKNNYEEAYKRSRPPEGLALNFSAFRLFEIFHLESFDQLYNGLVKLLPTLIDHPTRQGFSSDFRSQSQTLSGTSWQKLGYDSSR